MNQLNEVLLGAWLRLSTSINNSRVVSDIPYNESLICNILYRNHIDHPERNLTATELCNETKMLKSQMNRTLNQMEAKNLITKERSESDKRKVYIRLNTEQTEIYLTQHAKILSLLDAIIEKLGEYETQEVIHMLNHISDVADDLIK